MTFTKTRLLKHDSPFTGRVVFQKGGFGGCFPGAKTGTKIHSDVPLERQLERGHVRMFPRNENQNEGTFAKTNLYETALLSPNETWGISTIFQRNALRCLTAARLQVTCATVQ